MTINVFLTILILRIKTTIVPFLKDAKWPISKIIGLDIGSYAVKMVEIDRSKKGYELQFIGTAPLPDGAIVDKSIKKADLVGNAIKALHSYSSRAKQVSTSLAGKAVIIKQVTMSSMSDNQLEKQIQMEAEPYIPFDIKDVNLDFFIMGDRPEKKAQWKWFSWLPRKTTWRSIWTC